MLIPSLLATIAPSPSIPSPLPGVSSSRWSVEKWQRTDPAEQRVNQYALQSPVKGTTVLANSNLLLDLLKHTERGSRPESGLESDR